MAADLLRDVRATGETDAAQEENAFEPVAGQVDETETKRERST